MDANNVDHELLNQENTSIFGENMDSSNTGGIGLIESTENLEHRVEVQFVKQEIADDDDMNPDPYEDLSDHTSNLGEHEESNLSQIDECEQDDNIPESSMVEFIGNGGLIENIQIKKDDCDEQNPELNAAQVGNINICDVCSKSFKSRKALFRHSRHHDAKDFSCVQCGESFTNLHSLKKHLSNHFDVTKNTCDICGHVFKRPGPLTMATHMLKHTGHGANLITTATHVAHLNDFKSYSCATCHIVFNELSSLNRHLRMHSHEMPPPRSQNKEPSASYSCGTCGKVFRKLGSLSKHLDRHTSGETYECDLCKKAFVSAKAAQRHMAKYCGLTSLQCNMCDKVFTKYAYLKQHTLIHSPQKSYVCKFCGKSYKQQSILTGHMSTHNEDKKHICDLCGMKFTQAGSLRRHKDLHSDTKAYSCNVCGRCFGQSQGLLTHMTTHSAEKPHKCVKCGATFRRSSSLKKHLKSCMKVDKGVTLPTWKVEPSETVEYSSLDCETNFVSDCFVEMQPESETLLG